MKWTRPGGYEMIDPQGKVVQAIERVHERGYLEYLNGVYQQWVDEGGNKEAVMAETFLRSDLLFEKVSDSSAKKEGAIARAGRYSFDLSCPITADTYLASFASAALTLSALDHLLLSSNSDHSSPGPPSEVNSTNQPSPPLSAFALCRPPGHHSTCNLSGGYCYLNNVAIAVKEYQQRIQLGSAIQEKVKVAILDIDYHHGNGTSRIFYEDPSVLYVSLHGSPDYPHYSGWKCEIGSGAGKGTNLNYPLKLGTTDDEYLATLSEALGEIVEWAPQFLVISLGVDTFHLDPLTDFQLTLQVYPKIGNLIGEKLGRTVPSLWCMEGGYCLEHIGNCVRGVLQGFQNAVHHPY